LFRTKEKELRTWLNAAEGEPMLGTVRGKLFEQLSHKQLCAGGDFEVRELGAGAAAAPRLHLPASTLLRFEGLEQVKAANATQYCVPFSINFPAVDALMQVRWLCFGKTRQSVFCFLQPPHPIVELQ
jgi:hypothetical protein